MKLPNREIDNGMVERIVRSIMDNYPEAGSGNVLQCVSWKYRALKFKFVDTNCDKTFEIGKDQLLAAFPLMFTDKWPKGLTQMPTVVDDWEEWDNWLCQADAGDFDGFIQLACLGDVIYG